MNAAHIGLVLAVGIAQNVPSDTTRFQQGVDYRIEARLEEGSDVLTARARHHYTNRSPAALDTLWFHLELNAFRPGSAWAARDLQFGNRRFADLGPNDHAFERLRTVKVGAVDVVPVYPGAPDSSVVAIPLPAPLSPGGRVTLILDWDARLSTLPRRQGRRGRHFDFAQWYPRIAPHDRGGWQVRPLLPQGEFYGEFATYDVTLDIEADQVVAATGIPVDGDPGWERARAAGSPAPVYRRDAYPTTPAEPLGLLDGQPDANRKRVRWRADSVHHFAWTTSPAYIYEGGVWNGTALHVLYQPGDAGWAGGVVVRRTADALAFMESVFGRYPWPQLTNVHRIEGGGTEFPMLVMDGSESEGLIVHEVAHQYVHGILANNEWREGWLDEGFASFLTNWYFERNGADLRASWRSALDQIRGFETRGLAQPIALPAAEFRDFQTYNAMTYTKPSLVLRMLRDMMGEQNFRTGLARYFEANRLRHVTESDFRRAMQSVHSADLGWFFDQWIHSTETLDYGIGELRARHVGDGWIAEVEVIRTGRAWMPVEIELDGQTRTLDSSELRQTVTFQLERRPSEVRLDPREILLDINPDNNVKRFEIP